MTEKQIRDMSTKGQYQLYNELKALLADTLELKDKYVNITQYTNSDSTMYDEEIIVLRDLIELVRVVLFGD